MTLDAECSLKTAGVAALTYKSISAGDFCASRPTSRSSCAASPAAGSTVERKTDRFGYEWVIVRDPDLEDQVAGVYALASELEGAGFRRAAARRRLPFRRRTGHEHPVYWIYGFKRGAWWPFIPTGESQERDNAHELELKAKLEKELPIEPDLSKWLGLFGAPI